MKSGPGGRVQGGFTPPPLPPAGVNRPPTCLACHLLVTCRVVCTRGGGGGGDSHRGGQGTPTRYSGLCTRRAPCAVPLAPRVRGRGRRGRGLRAPVTHAAPAGHPLPKPVLPAPRAMSHPLRPHADAHRHSPRKKQTGGSRPPPPPLRRPSGQRRPPSAARCRTPSGRPSWVKAKVKGRCPGGLRAPAPRHPLSVAASLPVAGPQSTCTFLRSRLRPPPPV